MVNALVGTSGRAWNRRVCSPTGSTPAPSATSASISEKLPPTGPCGTVRPDGVRSGVRSCLNAVEVTAGYCTTGWSPCTSSDTDS
ncbi:MULTISPECIES: hypothetical protein [unclassified Micromonospora]|uniref:hypothetical protein n=1 Tax=unclassified Micromonospora TaxID=2617518 RepID=UPI00259CD7CB|nr:MULTISPECIES: hypothetical protein [unclassified Micromonospora]MDM4784658.1 hypothetical protein [Micromonospora sp. b486]